MTPNKTASKVHFLFVLCGDLYFLADLSLYLQKQKKAPSEDSLDEAQIAEHERVLRKTQEVTEVNKHKKRNLTPSGSVKKRKMGTVVRNYGCNKQLGSANMYLWCRAHGQKKKCLLRHFREHEWQKLVGMCRGRCTGGDRTGRTGEKRGEGDSIAVVFA